MAQGKLDPANIPDDGLTTRQRRNLPITAVHTGTGKGKSTAAFGMAMRAWNQGLNVGVFQFVKSAKWRVGEESVFKRLGELHEQTGEGGAVEWHKMGEGWSWSKKQGSEEDHARDAAEGWEEIKRRLGNEAHDIYVLDEFTYPIKWGWIDVDDVVATLQHRPGKQHVVITGRDADPKLIEVADLVTEMTKIKHPFDAGRKGQKGIEW
ncbi:cob(I)yrinic acid a,c-diamide adenosyltransferase [Corynebacterium pelargi]|uniref:Cob(I)yrinic acid a,c-diamide adenosyltransferase n=1 Tax=Corynebacterium pelargi TaxID=1471400 RepID=A0A410W858_9CORY|nr:cob(I)yrinic acid a,c-diamide adenosyltransferase [Corynebacterium pelargi]QAU52145.1 Cob(I)yrinic acid a,c-diamide adenosyltransferase [Corynebacterium pelargi]GGG69826.1 cob(I)alamin adenolsyltransferase/cobinamide ATP-dependent adenolsyltransferase [Corynebacterium pelargi]